MPSVKKLQQDLLSWYDRHRRVMPWRAARGARPDPYHVWLSEIMLQQTTVVTVGPYFEKFIRKWPTVKKLAAAELDDVLAAWAGLIGRARIARRPSTRAVAASDAVRRSDRAGARSGRMELSPESHPGPPRSARVGPRPCNRTGRFGQPVSG